MNTNSTIQGHHVSPKQLKRSLVTMLKAGLTTMIWGVFGNGKTSIARQAIAELGWREVYIPASIYTPEDIRGIGLIDGDKIKFTKPDFWPEDDDVPTVLVVDEIADLTPAMQGVMYQLILERAVGQFKLPKCVKAIIATGNRDVDGAIGGRMTPALRTRFAAHYVLEVDVESTTEWMLENFSDPRIPAFLRLSQRQDDGKSEMLHSWNFDNRRQKEHDTYSTPRTWEYADKILLAYGYDARAALTDLCACLTEPVAYRFVAFCDIADKVQDPRDIVKNPKGATTYDSDIACAMFTAASLARIATVDNFEAICQYASRHVGEVNTVIFKTVVSAHPEVKETRAYVDWTSRFDPRL